MPQDALVLRQVMSAKPGGNRWAAMNLEFPLTVVGGVDWVPPLRVATEVQICAPPDFSADGPPPPTLRTTVPSCQGRSAYICGLGSSPQPQFREAWLFRFHITCLQLRHNGWALAEHTIAPGLHDVAVMSTGAWNATTQREPHSWIAASLSFSESDVTAWVAGQQLGPSIRLGALNSTRGMAGLGSGWSATAFRAFEVSRPPPLSRHSHITRLPKAVAAVLASRGTERG
eukprot:COSAG01_NODE_2586_length_7416_cov_48.667213_3_plen_229_part_00